MFAARQAGYRPNETPTPAEIPKAISTCSGRTIVTLDVAAVMRIGTRSEITLFEIESAENN